ncbi:hypothetical protein [Burkholderia sp. 22PA0106]|uniref:hypothetical protein n=1 Tax=Burkholderia sp. 22PA0106 TaxID=3237371 RepID=UPI0039C01A7E
MRAFIQFSLSALGEQHHTYARLPDKQLEGQQTRKNWNIDKTDDGKVAMGV